MDRFPFPEAVGLALIAVLTILGGCVERTPEQEAEASARQDYSDKVLRSMRMARICGDNAHYIFVSFDGRLWMSSYQDVQGWGWQYVHPIAAGVTLKDVC